MSAIDTRQLRVGDVIDTGIYSNTHEGNLTGRTKKVTVLSVVDFHDGTGPGIQIAASDGTIVNLKHATIVVHDRIG
jgi:hypothetical protein